MIYLPNGETLEEASATGKYCTNYDAEVKALEQGAQAVIDLTDANSENVVFLTDSRSVLDSLVGHGEHNLRRKLYRIFEHRRVVLQWIPAHCGIKGNEHADRLAKQGANMEQEKLPITLKQKKTIMKNMFRAKKMPDDYHTLDRAGQVTLIRRRTGHNRLNSHMHINMNHHYVPVEPKIRQQNTYCKDVQHTNISDNRHGQTEHHYTRSCMGRKKY